MATRRSHTSLRQTPPSPPPSPTPPPEKPAEKPDWWSDRYAIFLLIALYAAQGLPMGLAFGTIPFLLKEHGASYADLATFSFASTPYSVKLFIAPIVDSLYNRRFGRRKSWIVPVQLVIGLTTFTLSNLIQNWVLQGVVSKLMPTFLIIIAMTATQDIAVDGWSLTMLSHKNVAYASTCQSLGLSAGYFATFTIFLAFSNPEFSNNYVRRYLPIAGSGPVVTLASALRLMGFYYLFLTAYVTFFKKEVSDVRAKKNDEVSPPSRERDMEHVENEGVSESESVAGKKQTMWQSICATYADLLVVIRLPAVQALVLSLLIAKVGFSAYDNVAPLKLLEFGFSKESMATLAVIQTPFSLLGTLFTGRMVAQYSPVNVYLTGFICRFILSLTGPPLVSFLSSHGTVSTAYYVLVLALTILYSLAAECLMFVGIGAFFLNITSASVHVAGSYLTLLNTSSNMGGIWHKALVLWLVDKVTIRERCVIPLDAAAGTLCPIRYDGYYILSAALLPVALAAGFHLFRALPRLSRLPMSSWQVSRPL